MVGKLPRHVLLIGLGLEHLPTSSEFRCLSGLVHRCVWLLSILWWCSVGGCARWSQEKNVDRGVNLLPPRQLNPDSILIETVLVRFPQSANAEVDELWKLCNEGVIELDLRQRLDKNGLRAGVILGELPPLISAQLDATAHKQTTDALEAAGLAADVDNKGRQLQCRAGRRKDLLVKPELTEPLTVLSTRDGQHVTGETFERATVLFDLRAMPHGDGSATVELTPEVQHGEHRQIFVHSDFGTRPEMRRGMQNWNELKIAAKLQPRQILMVSSTSPPKALGKAFFVSKTAEQTEERVVLLVFLAETQLDDLFDPEAVEMAHASAER